MALILFFLSLNPLSFLLCNLPGYKARLPGKHSNLPRYKARLPGKHSNLPRYKA